MSEEGLAPSGPSESPAPAPAPAPASSPAPTTRQALSAAMSSTSGRDLSELPVVKPGTDDDFPEEHHRARVDRLERKFGQDRRARLGDILETGAHLDDVEGLLKSDRVRKALGSLQQRLPGRSAREIFSIIDTADQGLRENTPATIDTLLRWAAQQTPHLARPKGAESEDKSFGALMQKHASMVDDTEGLSDAVLKYGEKLPGAFERAVQALDLLFTNPRAFAQKVAPMYGWPATPQHHQEMMQQAHQAQIIQQEAPRLEYGLAQMASSGQYPGINSQQCRAAMAAELESPDFPRNLPDARTYIHLAYLRATQRRNAQRAEQSREKARLSVTGSPSAGHSNRTGPPKSARAALDTAYRGHG